jgi:hypothetical protein
MAYDEWKARYQSEASPGTAAKIARGKGHG